MAMNTRDPDALAFGVLMVDDDVPVRDVGKRNDRRRHAQQRSACRLDPSVAKLSGEDDVLPPIRSQTAQSNLIRRDIVGGFVRHDSHWRQKVRILNVHQALQKGQRGNVGAVGDRLTLGMPSSGKKQAARAVENIRQRCVARSPEDHQAAAPQAIPPSISRTTSAPCSVCAASRGVAPSSIERGLRNQTLAFSLLSRAISAWSWMLTRRIARSVSTAFSGSLFLIL